MDKIFLHQLEVETIIGVWDWEREIKQRVIIDLEMAADIKTAALNDAINDTLNYKTVAKRLIGFVSDSEFQLVETLAERIAAIVVTEFEVTIEFRENEEIGRSAVSWPSTCPYSTCPT